jgi:hypothetical protein
MLARLLWLTAAAATAFAAEVPVADGWALLVQRCPSLVSRRKDGTTPRSAQLGRCSTGRLRS